MTSRDDRTLRFGFDGSLAVGFVLGGVLTFGTGWSRWLTSFLQFSTTIALYVAWTLGVCWYRRRKTS